jgi:hypothetical protein
MVRDRKKITFTLLEGKINPSQNDFSSEVCLIHLYGEIVSIWTVFLLYNCKCYSFMIPKKLCRSRLYVSEEVVKNNDKIAMEAKVR